MLKYQLPRLQPLNQRQSTAQRPCWSGGVAFGGQCATGGTAGTSCVSGHSPFSTGLSKS